MIDPIFHKIDAMFALADRLRRLDELSEIADRLEPGQRVIVNSLGGLQQWLRHELTCVAHELGVEGLERWNALPRNRRRKTA